jgi:hypothetical protein
MKQARVVKKNKKVKEVDVFQDALGFEESAERWSVADKPKSLRFVLKAIKAYTDIPEDREAVYNRVRALSLFLSLGQASPHPL